MLVGLTAPLPGWTPPPVPLRPSFCSRVDRKGPTVLGGWASPRPLQQPGAPRAGGGGAGPQDIPCPGQLPTRTRFPQGGQPSIPRQEARKPEVTLTWPSGTRVGLWPSGGSPQASVGRAPLRGTGHPQATETSGASRTGLLPQPRGVSSQGDERNSCTPCVCMECSGRSCESGLREMGTQK